MKKTGFGIPHLSGVAFIQAHNRPTKLAKRRPMKFIQGLEFTHYLTNSSDSFTNLEFRIKEFV